MPRPALEEHWGGVIGEEGNLGRTDFIADVNAGWTFTRGWTATLGLRVPFFSLDRGEQSTYPGILTIGVATDFALRSQEWRRCGGLQLLEVRLDRELGLNGTPGV